MAGIGEFALFLALASAAWGLSAALRSARDGRVDLARSAQGALLATALSLTTAAVALFAVLFGRDFSVVYVVEYTSRSMSVFYTLAAFWAGQNGSLLLWAWLASLCGVLVVRRLRRVRQTPRAKSPVQQAHSYVVATLAGVLLLFTALLAFIANPFERLPSAMPDGQGLNPLLQDYGQWVHPLTLYAGMVALSVPFAYCVGGLAASLPDREWLVPARRWTMWAWILLTTGIVLGMRWSYVELGWGGYWAWDPVENASLLPWLTATAFLHSAPLQQYKGMFRLWNPILVFVTFSLTLLGTFLTRSGVVSSVHAFAESALGPFLLAGFGVTVLLGGALIVMRLPALRAGSRVTGLSGDGAVALGGTLLTAMTGVVLWGTVFPLTTRTFEGAQSSVGPSFYQALVGPMAVALLLAMGVHPLLAGARGTSGMRGEVVRALAAGLGTMAVAGALGHGRHTVAIVVMGVCGFAAFATGEPVARAAAARFRGRRAGDRGGRDRCDCRRVGAAVAHIGLALFIAAVAVNMTAREHTRVNLQAGQSARIGDYTIRLDGVREDTRADGQATIATMTVMGAGAGGGKRLGELTSEQFTAATQGQPVVEVGIRSTATEDLYVALEGVDTSGGATIGMYVNPAVAWIWAGAFGIVAGAVIARWPGLPGALRRRKRGAEPGSKAGSGVGAASGPAGAPEPGPVRGGLT